MYIVARIADGELMVVSGKYYTGEPDKASAIAAVVALNGGANEDYSHIHFDDSTEDAIRLTSGWEFLIVWNDDGVTIDGVDFTPELSKPILYFEADTTVIDNDNVDVATITITAKDQETGEVDETVTGEHLIPFRSQIGAESKKRAAFTLGVATIEYKSMFSGRAIFPISPTSFDGFRVGSVVTIDLLDA